MEVGAKTSGPTLQRRLRPPKRPLQELRSRVTRGVSCSLPRLRSTFLGFFPVVSWLPRYRLREYVWGDVMSGLIVGIILVPQAIAYCLLAGVQPIYGLYTSFFANIIYFFMGTSRHVSVGIFSLMSLMVGQVVDREVFLAGFELGEGGAAAGNGSLGGGAGNGTTTELACGKECYAIGIAAALTFLAGIYQVLMAVFRLGFVSVYLSAPMLDGFATGASFTILTVQAKYLLGLKIPRYQGYGTVVVTWFRIFSNIQHTNMCDLVTSAICISVLVAGKELQERFKSRLKIPLPTELLVVTAATLASHFADLGGRYASSVSGHIPTGFVAPEVPRLDLMPRVALDAVPLAVISFAFTVSLSEMFAKKNGYSVRPNQEMLAIGCCNIVPSFFHCFTTSAALAKTMVKDSTGCQTQVSSLVSALVVLLVLLFFAPYFYALQKCVLACIIIVSLRGALRKFLDVPDKWRASKADAVVWLVTTASSALISVELGLLVGVAFSMGVVVYRTQNAAASLLGRADGSELYEDMEEYRGLSATPGVRVFRFRAPLYYANKDAFAKSLYKAVGLEPFAELARRRKAQKKKKARELETAKRAAVGDVGGPSSSSDKTNGEASVRLTSGGGGGGGEPPDFHAIVLDCSSVPFVDSAGAAAFGSLRKEYGEVGVSVLLAACNTDVVDALGRASYFGKGGGDAETDGLMFHTVHAAVLRAAADGATSAAANAATAATAASVV